MSQANKQLVRDFYGTSLAGDTEAYARFLVPDFKWYVPSILPWGGDGVGATRFVTHILSRVAKTFDFARFGYDAFTADETTVSAFVYAGLSGHDDITRLAETWTVKDGKLTSLRVFYFDPLLVINAVRRREAEPA